MQQRKSTGRLLCTQGGRSTRGDHAYTHRMSVFDETCGDDCPRLPLGQDAHSLRAIHPPQACASRPASSPNPLVNFVQRRPRRRVWKGDGELLLPPLAPVRATGFLHPFGIPIPTCSDLYPPNFLFASITTFCVAVALESVQHIPTLPRDETDFPPKAAALAVRAPTATLTDVGRVC